MDKRIKEHLEKVTRARLVYNTKTLEVVGIFNEWRKANPAVIPAAVNLATCDIGWFLTHDYGKEKREKLGLQEIHEDMLKRHAKEIEERREKARPEAMRRLDAMQEALEEIQKQHKCDLYMDVDGDTYGVDYCLKIYTTVDGEKFERVI